jgi:hypothetical protein
MDLIDAFVNIGLPDGGKGCENAPDDSVSAGRVSDYAAPSIDRLRQYYLVSRGRDNARES